MPDARIPSGQPENSRTLAAQSRDERDWRETLPAEWTAPGRDETGQEANIPLRRHPVLAKYASKDEAIKALVHAQRLLGKKGDSGPGRSLLSATAAQPGPSGVPTGPEEYTLPELPLPEDFCIDEKLRTAFLAKAHELGLTDEQTGGLYAWFLPLNVEAVQHHSRCQEALRSQNRQSQIGALRKSHGDSAREVMENARKAVLALGGAGLLEVLESTGAGDDAQVVQAFARIAPLVTEAGLRGQNAAPSQGLTPQRLREMMRDPRYHDPSRRDAEYVRQVQQGFDALFPGEQSAPTRMS